jgi:hypothetical protein
MEIWPQSRATLTARTLMGLAAHSATIALGVAVAACLLSACSPGAEYTSLYPAVHDTPPLPPPRTDTTLDAQQVQQATEDLISDRNRLNSQAQSGPSKAPLNLAPKSPNSAAAAKKAKAKTPPPAAASTQTAGTETK